MEIGKNLVLEPIITSTLRNVVDKVVRRKTSRYNRLIIRASLPLLDVKPLVVIKFLRKYYEDWERNTSRF